MTKEKFEMRISRMELGVASPAQRPRRRKHREKHKALGVLRADMKANLLQIKLEEVDLAQAINYHQKEEEIKRWELLVRKLKSEANARWNEEAARIAQNRLAIQERHRRDLERWPGEVKEWESRYSVLLRIVKRLRRDFENMIHAGARIPVNRVPWTLLPRGEMHETAIIKILRDYRCRHVDVRVDTSRVKFAFSLRPKSIYVGTEEFDGYFAFVFSHTDCVLMDHPIVGHAAYVFHRNWLSLSKLSKSELTGTHMMNVTKVVHSHSGDWRTRLRHLLRAKA